jgi:hypothetical protein
VTYPKKFTHERQEYTLRYGGQHFNPDTGEPLTWHKYALEAANGRHLLLDSGTPPDHPHIMQFAHEAADTLNERYPDNDSDQD